MQELINSLQQNTGLPADAAQAAADHVLGYLKNNIPPTIYNYVEHAAKGQPAAKSLIGLEGRIGFFGH